MHSSLASRCFILVLAILLITSRALAQTNANMNGSTNTGFPDNGVLSGSNFDNVQVNNGNLHIEIPVETLSGRGQTIAYKFVYDSKGWMFVPQLNLPPNHPWGRIVGQGNLGLNLQGEDSGYHVEYHHEQIQCGWSGDIDPFPIYGIHYFGYTLYEPNGTKHPFPG